jgi:hypothetical protein
MPDASPKLRKGEMATKLPYVVQPGSISKIFEKVRQAQTPERFTVDFLQTKLGFRGGNYRQFIPLAKKIGFLGTDGKPTDFYKRFRNSEQGGASGAVSRKIRTRTTIHSSPRPFEKRRPT